MKQDTKKERKVCKLCKKARVGKFEVCTDCMQNNRESRKKSPKEICNFFAKYGRCRDGDNCKYLHEENKQSDFSTGNSLLDEVMNYKQQNETKTINNRESFP